MASPVTLYHREMYDNMGFFATWLPGDPINIGDIGILERGRFKREGSLADLNIKSTISTGDSTQDVQYTSKQGTKVNVSAQAEVPTVGKGQISIEFSSEGAFVFNVSSLQALRLENRMKVGQQIMESFERGEWKDEWLVVEAVHEADRATIIVSQDSSSGIVIEAKVEGPALGISLADPKADLRVTSSHGRLLHIIGSRSIRPLYACLKLNVPLLGNPSVGPVRGSGGSSSDTLTRPSIEDLLNS